ncbi:class I SAM-dependent methyltransferase [Anabaena sp. CCY 9402-a]|uniref:class I SAM-dependent methyltransferase n=1 Tax=Anabaena sp. CCY 9402-a TaxID=3103867 RepID=UPI0039C6D636
MPFPPQTYLYELDLPELIQYRETILQSKQANCHRQAIAADLTQPWSHLLAFFFGDCEQRRNIFIVTISVE